MIRKIGESAAKKEIRVYKALRYALRRNNIACEQMCYAGFIRISDCVTTFVDVGVSVRFYADVAALLNQASTAIRLEKESTWTDTRMES